MKAQTAAVKYAFMLSFAMSTGDDPEADSRVDVEMNASPKPVAGKPKPQNNVGRVKSPSRSDCVCYDCGTFISQKVADYSKNKFGKYLCYDCQHSQEQVA